MAVVGMTWWMAAGLIATIYCIVRVVLDLREKRYVWAGIGACCAALLLFAPNEAHVVKIDLPQRPR
jgi:hypothetical protein